MNLIPRSTLSVYDAYHLDVCREHGRRRRANNIAAGVCVNETKKQPSHGKATHGRLCLACREMNRGHRLESMFGVERYRLIAGAAKSANVTIESYVREHEPALIAALSR